jgi:hypothetical protein
MKLLRMPAILRSRVALLGLLGVFLIPIFMSSLRGLTHVLTCRESVRTPFTLFVREDAPPQAVTSTLVRRHEAGICGALDVQLGARVAGARELAMVVPITNNSSYPWRGTVQLELDNLSIPVDIGAISAGATETDTVTFRLDRGAHDVSGSLLIGP